MNTIKHIATILAIGACTAIAFVGDAVADSPHDTPPKGIQDRSQNGDGYRIEVSDVSAKAGQAASFAITIKAVDGYKVNAEYPHKVQFKNLPKGLKLDKKLLNDKNMKAVDKHTLRATNAVTAESAGKHAIEALVKTSVCNDSHCLFKKETVTFYVDAS